MKTQQPNLLECVHRSRSILGAVILLLTVTLGHAAPISLDVNDVSFLFPLPKEPPNVEALLSLADQGSDGDLMSDELFDLLLKEARAVKTEGAEHMISFPPELEKKSAWKIAGIRVNPSAIGTEPKFMEKAGEVPSLRLVVQPVVINGDEVVLHDFAAHVVFDYALAQPSPLPPKPEREAFRALITDLVAIKTSLADKDVQTTGALLSVHPGFAKNAQALTGQLRDLLKKHMNQGRLHVISFMGIPGGFEPWIFFKVGVTSKDGKVAVTRRSIDGHFEGDPKEGQLALFKNPVTLEIIPSPRRNAGLESGFGISTALLFDKELTKKAATPLFSDGPLGPLAKWQIRDVADLIANPLLHTTRNTDCISCHTETTRRTILNLQSQPDVAFKLPNGISGVEPKMLPKDVWNLRDFGWGLAFFEGAIFLPTIAQRAANEAAESAAYINRVYLGQGN